MPYKTMPSLAALSDGVVPRNRIGPSSDERPNDRTSKFHGTGARRPPAAGGGGGDTRVTDDSGPSALHETSLKQCKELFLLI